MAGLGQAPSSARPRRARNGGLITSTLLTLFVTPVVYSMLDLLVNQQCRGRSMGEHSDPPRRGVPEPALSHHPKPWRRT